MNVLQKIGCAAFESLGGGGGIAKFFDRQIDVMPDYERAMLANKLCAVMPELTAKFQKIGRYEAWFQSLLVEHLWYRKIRGDKLWALCKVGINDSNVTHERLLRNLHNVLDTYVPGWEIVSLYEPDDDSRKKAEYYMLGELAAACATFLSHYPNATFPDLDEEMLVERREADVVEETISMDIRGISLERQQVQIQRLLDGLPVYGYREGPDRLEDEDDLG